MTKIFGMLLLPCENKNTNVVPYENKNTNVGIPGYVSLLGLGLIFYFFMSFSFSKSYSHNYPTQPFYFFYL